MFTQQVGSHPRETRCGPSQGCPNILSKINSQSLLTLHHSTHQGRRSSGAERVPEVPLIKLLSPGGNVRNEEEVPSLISFLSICLWSYPMHVTCDLFLPSRVGTPGIFLIVLFLCLLCPGNLMLCTVLRIEQALTQDILGITMLQTCHFETEVSYFLFSLPCCS